MGCLWRVPGLRMSGLAFLALSFAGAAQANVIFNGTFAAPAAGFQIGSNPYGTGYSYVTQSLVAVNSSWTWTEAGVLSASAATPWYGSSPPSGAGASQYAFLQRQGASLAQSFTLSGPSSVVVTWSAAGRPAANNYGGNTTYSVTAGGLQASDSTASGTNFVMYTLSGLLPQGTYPLQFLITAASGDQTAFISNVAVTAQTVPEPPSIALLLPGVALLAIRLRRRPIRPQRR